MPRTARYAPGGMIFHVLNRGVGRMRLLLKDGDFEAFERTIERTLETCPMRICAYCLLSNHWHFVLWPERDGELGAFMQKLTITHARNWQVNRHRVGYGHLYQGRYKSFPVQDDEHFYQVVRYVERNALRANLVERAEEWRWSSLWRRVYGTADDRRWLAKWPLPRPRNWVDLVNAPQTETELEAIRRSVTRGQPYGQDNWIRKTAKRLGLESTLRSRGRPRKDAANN
jgi:putative transposase